VIAPGHRVKVNSSGYRGRMDHPDQVAGYVARTALGEATTPVRLAAGAWSTAYALTIAGRAMVLRVSRYGGDFAKDEAVSAVVGGTLPASRTAAYRSWPQYLLATEHETPRVPGWRAALAASDIGLEPLERGLATLRRLAPDLPDERRMIHDDLLARNVLVAGDRISGVLDWGSACFGDPLYDAAWLLYCWGWYPQWSAVDIEAAIGHRWNPDPAALRAYRIHIGLGSIGYCATRDRWDDVALNAEWLLALA
jgi:hypothetical protein